MPQSLSRIWLHIVFSTKERKRYLQNEQFRTEMFRMLSHEVKAFDCISGGAGGHVDHVHLLVGLSRTVAVADLIKHVKIRTSKWAKTTERGVSTFQWQAGYGVFSVSQSNCAAVSEYILNQADHHREMSFQDELRTLCEKHEIEIDERYVWE